MIAASSMCYLNVEGLIKQEFNTRLTLLRKVFAMKSIFEILKLVNREPRRLV